MRQLSVAKPPVITDWDGMYRQGTPPWDAGVSHAELLKVLDEYSFPKGGTVLEIGCGTGSDAICFAKRRFEVTAIDCSPIALERAGFAPNSMMRCFVSCSTIFSTSPGP